MEQIIILLEVFFLGTMVLGLILGNYVVIFMDTDKKHSIYLKIWNVIETILVTVAFIKLTLYYY